MQQTRTYLEIYSPLPKWSTILFFDVHIYTEAYVKPMDILTQLY